MAKKTLHSLSELHLPLSTLGEKTLYIDFTADATSISEICGKLKIVDVNKASAQFDIKRDGQGTGAHLRGDVTASVVQACVVTLEAVEQEISVKVTRHFVPEDRIEALTHEAHSPDGDIIVDLDASDDVEVLVDDALPLADMILETIALELDPYPKIAGAALSIEAPTPPDEAEKANPFGVLAQLKPKIDG